MFYSEQLYITLHIRKTQGTTINFSFIKSYFTYLVAPDVDADKCSKLVCGKVISYFVVCNFLQKHWYNI